MNLQVSEEERSAIELGGYNLGGYSYKSDVFEKPIISHADPFELATTDHNRPPNPFETKNLKESESTSTDTRTRHMTVSTAGGRRSPNT